MGASTHFHHLYTRRGCGGSGGGGGGYLVDISVFPIPGVSALFHQSSFPLASLPTTPGETARRALSPLYFRTGLNHRRGFPAVFAADEKGSGLYLARCTLPPLPRLFRSSLPAIPLIPLWNYDGGDMRARAVAELSALAAFGEGRRSS